jgi:hypothetical protein
MKPIRYPGMTHGTCTYCDNGVYWGTTVRGTVGAYTRARLTLMTDIRRGVRPWGFVYDRHRKGLVAVATLRLSVARDILYAWRPHLCREAIEAGAVPQPPQAVAA